MGKGNKEQVVITMNEYERKRLQRVQECKSRLKESGILQISKSLTNLVESNKNKKRKNEAKGHGDAKDPDYSPHNETNGTEEQDEERQSSNGFEATKKPRKNKEQHSQHHDEESGTATQKQLNTKRMTRGTATQSQKFVPPMMLKKLVKQTQQWRHSSGGANGKGKAPTMGELILKNKQPEKDASMKNPGPLVVLSGNQSQNDENLDWLAELDEGRYFDLHGGEDDNFEGEPENQSDEESELEGIEEDGDDNDNDNLNGAYEDGEEEDNVNEDECADKELQVQGATGRGPTMLHHVHMRPLEKREAIILNEYGQPIGPVTPEKDTEGEFSRFLGTIARIYDNAPLTYKTWRSVPNKDKLWDYVLTKYMVPEDGKDWVLKSIGSTWRVHKCRFKKRHFHQYTTNAQRWKKRPKTVPKEDFKKLLILWSKKEEKDRCKANQDRRKAQKNNHTAGPKSFARIREEMKNEDPNKEPPSLVQLFERTRERDEKKKYADTYEDTTKKIEAMKCFQPKEDGSGPKDAFLSVMNKEYPGRRRLYGRGVTTKVLNKGSAAAIQYVVPDEIVDKLREDMEARNTKVADIRKELEADYEQKKADLEADYAKKMEEFEKSKEGLVEEVLKKLIAKLPTDVVRDYLA